MGVPSSASDFEPREMSAERRRAENRVRVLLEFLVGNCLLDRDLMGYVRKGSLGGREENIRDRPLRG